MISYREKTLLMTMKYLQDETAALSEEMKQVLAHMEENEVCQINGSFREPLEDFDELTQLAVNAGYDIYIRADDILSPEEIADLEQRKREIEEQFRALVKLRGADYGFLFSAVLLQLAKQVIFKLDLERHEAKASDADDDYADKYENPKNVDGKNPAKRYYAPMQQITNTKTVPYDIVKNTKFFGGKEMETQLGLSGENHRFKSVGHDPILGLLFGTSNILTNTATFYMKPGVLSGANAKYLNKFLMASFHVRYGDMSLYRDPYIASFASSALMFDKVYKRVKSEPEAFVAALVKEIDHIDSDKQSVVGIPLPFISTILTSDEVQELALKGFDWDHFLKNAAVVGKQAGATLTINLTVALLHRIYLLWGHLKEESSIIDALKVYIHTKPDAFNNIRTKKIVMYSDVIASTVNLAVCIGGGAVSMHAGQPTIAKEFISHLDIGGLMITLGTLFKDERYILKVKDDFIKTTISEEFQHRLEEIEKNNALEENVVS